MAIGTWGAVEGTIALPQHTPRFLKEQLKDNSSPHIFRFFYCLFSSLGLKTVTKYIDLIVVDTKLGLWQENLFLWKVMKKIAENPCLELNIK